MIFIPSLSSTGKKIKQAVKRRGSSFGIVVRSPYAYVPLLLLLSGLYAVWMGQDGNWDLRNYHYYNGYASLTDRYWHDVVPAQIQTYSNPLPDVLIYILIANLPPVLVTFFLGTLHGLNLVLLILIIHFLIRPYFRAILIPVALTLAAIGFSGAGMLSEIGGTFNDALVAPFILLSLFFMLRCLRARSLSSRHVWLMFGSLGVAAGLKLNAAFYAPALAVLGIALPESWQKKLNVLGHMIAASVFGFAISGGYWVYRMLDWFAHPLFPFFLSPHFDEPTAKFFDFRRWNNNAPHTIGDALRYPFQFVFARWRQCHCEFPFRDFRFPLVFTAALMHFVAATVRHMIFKARISAHGIDPARSGVIVFFFLSFVIWMLLGGIYRYALPLEFIAPVVLLLLLPTSLLRKEKIILTGSIVLLIVLLATTTASNKERFRAGKTYFDIHIPPVSLDNSQLLMFTKNPYSYIIPSLPSSVQIIRMQGNFLPAEPSGEEQIYRRIERAVSTEKKKFALLPDETHQYDEAFAIYAQRFHISIDFTKCELLTTRFDRLRICPASRTESE